MHSKKYSVIACSNLYIYTNISVTEETRSTACVRT